MRVIDQKQRGSFERELEDCLTVQELEQRLEMASCYCCDYPNHPESCGCDGVF